MEDDRLGGLMFIIVTWVVVSAFMCGFSLGVVSGVKDGREQIKDCTVEAGVAEYAYGDKEWYLNGKRHREDGPAIEYANGDKYWYINGKLHRVDGPAIEYNTGTKVWCLDSSYYTEKEYYKELYKRGLISKVELLVELI